MPARRSFRPDTCGASIPKSLTKTWAEGPAEDILPGAQAQSPATAPDLPIVNHADDIRERHRSSWSPVDLETTLAGEISESPPTILRRTDGVGLLYAGKVHALYGEPETGKSWLGLIAIAEVIREGRFAVFLDLEDSPSAAATRLRALRVPDDEIAERLLYLRPFEALDAEGREALRAICSLAPAVVVMDAMNDVVALHGLDPNASEDIAKLNTWLLRPFAEVGAAVVVIDHVVKRRDDRGRFAFGSQHRLAIIDGAAFAIDAVTPFGRGRQGRARIRLTKDRSGFLRTLAQHGDEALAELVIRSVGDDQVEAELRPAGASLGELGLKTGDAQIIDVVQQFGVTGATPPEVRRALARVGRSLAEGSVRKRLDALVEAAVLDVAAGVYFPVGQES